jgi:hypothetical protein
VFLRWLEASPLGHFMRESWVWTYSLFNLAHILGVALLFGAIVVLDLRLLGAWSSIPLALLSRPLVTVAASGVALAASTGIFLLATKAHEYASNNFLAVKIVFITLALLNIVLLHRSPAWKAHAVRPLTLTERQRLAARGAASLMLWLGAIICGRMIAYW